MQNGNRTLFAVLVEGGAGIHGVTIEVARGFQTRYGGTLVYADSGRRPEWSLSLREKAELEARRFNRLSRTKVPHFRQATSSETSAKEADRARKGRKAQKSAASAELRMKMRGQSGSKSSNQTTNPKKRACLERKLACRK
jgi:hypothetical protein